MADILITGGCGYIGSHTAVEFINSGMDIVIVDNFSNSDRSVLGRLQQITGKRIRFYECDAADPQAMEKVFSENRISAVIHFAGFKAVGESVKKPLAYYRNNIDSTLTLLELMKKHNCYNFIFSSSATVYGESKDMKPFTENDEAGKCSNPYGRTKYMIEEILRDAANADDNLSVVLLRYFNPIGAHESGLIGENPVGIPNNLMPFITQVAVGKLPKLRVFGNDYPTPDGSCIRDYIHVADLAAGHMSALLYAENHTGCEVFNLGTGKGTSVLEMVETFRRVNDVELPYEIADRREGDVPYCVADPTKANKVLLWECKKTLDDMCRDSWRWQKNCIA